MGIEIVLDYSLRKFMLRFIFFSHRKKMCAGSVRVYFDDLIVGVIHSLFPRAPLLLKKRCTSIVSDFRDMQCQSVYYLL
jgi:hypothetical protein